MVDELTEKSRIPFTRFGIQWKGSSATIHSSFVRRVAIIGTKDPDNFFHICLPEKALQPERNKEGKCVHISVWYLYCEEVNVPSELA